MISSQEQSALHTGHGLDLIILAVVAYSKPNDIFIYLFIYLTINQYMQKMILITREKITEHALGVTKGGKPPLTRHSIYKFNTN